MIVRETESFCVLSLSLFITTFFTGKKNSPFPKNKKTSNALIQMQQTTVKARFIKSKTFSAAWSALPRGKGK
jgi:hypothetical protein